MSTRNEICERAMKFDDEGRIPKYGVPDKILFVDAIPKTSVGKISKVELRKTYH
jgi:fatty-acyl-CoA synthase